MFHTKKISFENTCDVVQLNLYNNRKIPPDVPMCIYIDHEKYTYDCRVDLGGDDTILDKYK